MLANVTAAIARNAVSRPQHPALVQASRVITYRELERLVSKLAMALSKVGIKTGDFIGVSMGDNVDHVIALLGAMRLGAVVIPLDVRWTSSETKNVTTFFSAKAIVSDSASRLPDGLPVFQFGTLMERQAATDFAPSTVGESPLLLSLSSGTTGTPKGPLVSHELYVRRLVCETVTLAITWQDVNLCATPLYFGGARNITLAHLFVGATVVIFPQPYEVDELARAVGKHAVTTIFLVPTLIRRALALPDAIRQPFSRLRLLISGGATLHGSEWRECRARMTPNLVNIYGTTEAGAISILRAEEGEHRPSSVGRPAFLTEVEVVDEFHRPVPHGMEGRIRYRSPSTPEGFYNNQSASAEAFHDGWFYPGDCGRSDEEGFLYVTGRTKDMVVRGGVNIYPAEIEAVLASAPHVADAAVIGGQSAEFGEELFAFIVPRNSDAYEPAILDHCRRNLAPYKVPSRIFVVPQLPRNSAGKVLKQVLAADLADLRNKPKT